MISLHNSPTISPTHRDPPIKMASSSLGGISGADSAAAFSKQQKRWSCSWFSRARYSPTTYNPITELVRGFGAISESCSWSSFGAISFNEAMQLLLVSVIFSSKLYGLD